jgi:predicted HAD superfamily Cof-like phosphohydrolase
MENQGGEFKVTNGGSEGASTDKFLAKIKKFNDMYGVESNDRPTNLGTARLAAFKSILAEELAEADDVAATLNKNPKEGLVELSDLLGDLIVYCASEMRRWGLPAAEILDVIMESNFSKLGADGKPIKDERGKIMKGPGYWKPEPKISELLKKMDNQ